MQEPEPRKVSPETKLIGILVAVGVLVAVLGAVILPAGLGQGLLGMVGLVLVLAALGVLLKGRSPTGKA